MSALVIELKGEFHHHYFIDFRSKFMKILLTLTLLIRYQIQEVCIFLWNFRFFFNLIEIIYNDQIKSRLRFYSETSIMIELNQVTWWLNSHVFKLRFHIYCAIINRLWAATNWKDSRWIGSYIATGHCLLAWIN